MRQEQDKVRAAVAAALAIASGYAAVASAQEAPSASDDASGQAVYQVDEIIVTAERREETAQKSSLAISVISPDELKNAGVTRVNDLQLVVPGLSISNGGSFAQTYLRGVGTFATDARAESSIAYSINGVPIARANGLGAIFYDLQRIEVLKGPQGTLYGRNASGGAINLITNRPNLDEFGANFLVEGGNFSNVQGTALVNAPIGDAFAVRAVAHVANRDGYLTDGYDDDDSKGARLLGLYKPSDMFSILVQAEYTDVGGMGAGVVPRSDIQPNPSDPYTGPSDPNQTIQPPTAAVPGIGTRILNDGFTDVEVKGYSAELNYNLGFATLTFIPTYRDTDVAYLTYTPGFRFNTVESSQETTGELRLGNNTDKIKWVAGLFYFDEDQDEAYQLAARPFQLSNQVDTLTTESKAVFAQATYSLTDTLRLIGGARYTDEDKTQAGLQTALNPATTAVTGTTNAAGQASFSDTSYKAGVEYDVGAENLLFATVATGFKSGGFLPNILAPNNTYDKEDLMAFTIGSKNRFLDNTLQVNFEGFYWDYDNKQERFLGATQTGTTGLLTVNAGKATLFGANVDVLWKFTAADSFRFNVEYLNTEYDTFMFNQFSPRGLPVAAGATTCAVGALQPAGTTPAAALLPPGTALQTIDCSGKNLIRAPELSGVVGYAHNFNIFGGANLVTGFNAIFASEQFLSVEYINTGTDDGYVTLNTDISYISRGGKWSLSAYGRNLSDEQIYTGGGRYAFATTDPTLFYANIGPPRTYGLRFEVNF